MPKGQSLRLVPGWTWTTLGITALLPCLLPLPLPLLLPLPLPLPLSMWLRAIRNVVESIQNNYECNLIKSVHAAKYFEDDVCCWWLESSARRFYWAASRVGQQRREAWQGGQASLVYAPVLWFGFWSWSVQRVKPAQAAKQ